MKNLILATASAALVVGLAACGSTSTPSAVPPDKDCAELSKPADPHNLIGPEWPWPACNTLSDVTPGVDKDRAEAIVFDARQHVVEAKHHIALLVGTGNKETNPEERAQFRDRIQDVRGRLASQLVDSTLALQGTPPEGFALGYTKHHNPLSCSDAWDFDKCIATGGKDKGVFPYETHSASPGLTEGQGR